MTPLRFDVTFRGVGRITNSAQTTKRAEFRRRLAVLHELYEHGQLDVLRAVKAGAVPMAVLLDAKRRGRLHASDLLAELGEGRRLFDRGTPGQAGYEPGAFTLALERLATAPVGRHAKPPGAATRRRYATSLRMLGQKAVAWRFLTADATVRDLTRVDWRGLQARWLASTGDDKGRSAADWNHLTRALSVFLTVHTGDVYAPLRRAVMRLVPTASEPGGRETDLTPAVLADVIGRAPEELRAIYWTLVLTGMRVGEYLRAKDTDLQPARRMVRVPGRKTAESDALLGPYDADWFAVIRQAVPCPIAASAETIADGERRGVQFDRRYDLIYREWKRAARAAGLADVTLHDLRKTFAQLAEDKGAAVSEVQAGLRHTSAAMALRYLKRGSRRKVTRAVQDALKAEGEA